MDRRHIWGSDAKGRPRIDAPLGQDQGLGAEIRKGTGDLKRRPELAARQLSKKISIARIRALAPNYFKYKMIRKRALPDGLEPFIPNTRAMEMSGRMLNLGPSGHVDEFARRNLPPSEQWPELLLDRPEFQYPEYLNAAVELTDRIVEKGFGDRTALIGNGRQRTYKELADWSNRLAHALVENYGVKPGNRILIRSGNNPALVAAWLAATKAGAVV